MSNRNDAARASGRLVDAITGTAHQIKSHLDQVVRRIAFVVVHHTRHASHSVIVERGTRSAKFLIHLKVHFGILVIPSSGDDLEGFIKAIGQERGAVNILLEVGSDRNSQASSNNDAIRETTAAKKVELGVAIIESNGGSGSSLERVESGSATNGESGARLSDGRTGSASDGANTQDNVLALNQFSRMEEHCLKNKGGRKWLSVQDASFTNQSKHSPDWLS